MAEQSGSQSSPKRRTRRAGATERQTRPASATSRKPISRGTDAVESLTEMIDTLIRENRKLKRQLDRLTQRGTASTETGIERGLRTIQRRVQQALGGSASTKRPTIRRAKATSARRTAKGSSASRSGRSGSASEPPPGPINPPDR
jgi:predicted RNase H-like nuclease (RuvC/YqgF family)